MIMKKTIPYLGWVLAFFLLWLRGCEPKQTTKHEREIKGDFKPVRNIVHRQLDTVYITNEKVSKSTDFEIYNENEALKQAYLTETDSLEREILYLKAIQLNEFYHTFDNDTINITVKGIVQGEVKSLRPFYTIKQKNSPEVKFRLLGGGGIGNSIDFDKPVFNAGIGFQNAKGNILRVGFDSEKRINVNYDFNIFTIKK